jgi:hypothetical protein
MSKVDCNKKRKGEQHAFMYNAKTGKYQRAQFCGPKTHVLQRIRDGCQGVSEADRVCRAHDLRFMLARGPNTAMWIRDADDRMVRKLKEIRKAGTDTRFNTDISMRGIQLKKGLEDYNILRKGSFGPATNAGEDIKPADRKFLQQELNRMTQQGYGSDLFLEGVKWAAKNKDTAIPLFGLASGALAGGIGYAGSKLFGKKKKKKQKGGAKKKPKKKVNKKKKKK